MGRVPLSEDDGERARKKLKSRRTGHLPVYLGLPVTSHTRVSPHVAICEYGKGIFSGLYLIITGAYRTKDKRR